MKSPETIRDRFGYLISLVITEQAETFNEQVMAMTEAELREMLIAATSVMAEEIRAREAGRGDESARLN